MNCIAIMKLFYINICVEREKKSGGWKVGGEDPRGMMPVNYTNLLVLVVSVNKVIACHFLFGFMTLVCPLKAYKGVCYHIQISLM